MVKKEDLYGPESLTLKAARVLANMSQEDAANHLHISVYVLRNFEQGRTPITLKAAREMAKLFKLPGEYVFKT